jgi:hypothetical protein
MNFSCAALDAAERHIADLAANRVRPCDKPNAFHHGLLLALVAELKATRAAFVAERERADGREQAAERARDEEQLDWVDT